MIKRYTQAWRDKISQVKKGKIPYAPTNHSRLLQSQTKVGRLNPNWKGGLKRKVRVDGSNYSYIHEKIRKLFGKADKCEIVDCLKLSTRFEWAKLKGKKYEAKRENFMKMCRKCHANYDTQ